MKYFLFLAFCFSHFGSLLVAQRDFGTYTQGVDVLQAETKQINQFFRRFNAEERPNGKRLYPGDDMYKDPNLRQKFLEILFDNSNRGISSSKKAAFIRTVLQSRAYLNLQDEDWFAEVKIFFKFKGKSIPAILFMEIQKEEVGSKWVIRHAYVDEFARRFDSPEPDPESQKFLHPMSHELDFINLGKIFREPALLEHYAHSEFRPDHLSILLYELKQGNMQFETVDQVKFHFFQVRDWYFEINEINRPGKNRGWLISSLSQVRDNEKDMVKRYLLRKE